MWPFQSEEVSRWPPPLDSVLKFKFKFLWSARGKIGAASTGVLHSSEGVVLAMISKHVGISHLRSSLDSCASIS